MSVSTSAFSSSDIDVIERKVTTSVVPATDIERVYEIARIVQWIKTGEYKRVALQFPDELIVDAVPVTQRLQKSVTATVFILGDTSYGSCCVDEIAAQHYQADSIVHFGRSCLSPTRRLPVLYIFGQQSIDHDDCEMKFRELFSDPGSQVIVMYDTVYDYAIDDIFERLRTDYSRLFVSELDFCDKRSDNSEAKVVRSCCRAGSREASPVCGCEETNRSVETKPTDVSEGAGREGFKVCGRKIPLLPDGALLEDFSVFYVGVESLTLTNLMMTLNKCAFYTYDPVTRVGQRQTLNISKALMKRYYCIERAKDARIVGIVAGTLGVADYLQMVNRLKNVINRAGKKSYTFVVGKLNVAKLANFMEVDIFVLVSCPENSLIDSSEFYRPVVTPFEMELACNKAREWTGDYVTDFRELLPGAAGFVDMPKQEDEGEITTDVSLVTNKLRSFGTGHSLSSPAGDTAVLPRPEAMAVTTASPQTAGEFLASRSWQGLEQKLGETPVQKAKEGIRGIAASYDHEGQTEQTN